jgi:hypothetical protein
MGKQEKFISIAERRTTAVLNTLRLLSQCSNRRTYEYTGEQVQKMFREIDRELKKAKEAFDQSHKKDGFRF